MKKKNKTNKNLTKKRKREIEALFGMAVGVMVAGKMLRYLKDIDRGENNLR